MNEIYIAIDNILKELVLSSIVYVFKEKIETENSYEFILVIQEKDIDFFKNNNQNGLIDCIQAIYNTALNLDKKVVIDLEVLEFYD